MAAGLSTLGLALVGCGRVAPAYARAAVGHPGLRLVGVTDLDSARARDLAAAHGTRALAGLDELLADTGVDLVVVLTPHDAHEPIVEACLRAGKHVYSEKPLAASAAAAQRLLGLARAQNLTLAASPCTFLGEAQQSAVAAVRSGRLGNVRLVEATVRAGRVESWHPRPQGLYAMGPLADAGAYPLALILHALGPAVEVTALEATLLAERRTREGEAFTVSGDHATALITLACGTLVRLSADHYAPRAGDDPVHFHGDSASLVLGSAMNSGAEVKVVDANGEGETLLPARANAGPDWTLGLLDAADAIREARPPLASGDLAAHALEVLDAARASAREGGAVRLATTRQTPSLLL